jgi:DNA-binding protein HU-beta
MNKSEVVSILAQDLEGLSKKDIERVIDAFSNLVGETLGKGEKVVITGLGTFEVRNRVARSGRNPRTGEVIDIPALKTPAFISGKYLKDCVRD